MKKQVPGQQQLFDPDSVTARQFEPVAGLEDHIASYMDREGLGKWSPPNPQLQVDHRRGFAQAKAYERAERAPQRPGIEASYRSMREHVGKQFDWLTGPKDQGGLGYSVEYSDTDPYDNVHSMADDIRQGRLKVLKTASTGGHAFFTDEENDKFRAVHDVFGHGAIGRGQSRHGEEAAYVAHRQMFPPEARAALTSETRGQNSYLNYGSSGTFPDQSKKLIGLPDWAESDGPVPKPGRSKKK
jgi:hypothetical protein